jgi:hypothetical protein
MCINGKCETGTNQNRGFWIIKCSKCETEYQIESANIIGNFCPKSTCGIGKLYLAPNPKK